MFFVVSGVSKFPGFPGFPGLPGARALKNNNFNVLLRFYNVLRAQRSIR